MKPHHPMFMRLVPTCSCCAQPIEHSPTGKCLACATAPRWQGRPACMFCGDQGDIAPGYMRPVCSHCAANWGELRQLFNQKVLYGEAVVSHALGEEQELDLAIRRLIWITNCRLSQNQI